MTTRDERSAHRLSLGPTPEEAGVLPSNRWTGPAPAPARGPDPRRPRGGPWLAGCVARRSPTTPGGGGAPGTYTHRRCLGTLRCPWRMNGRGAHDGVEGKEPNPTGRPMAECVPGQSRRGDRVGGGGGPAARDRQAEVLLRLQGEVQREHGAGGGGVGWVRGRRRPNPLGWEMTGVVSMGTWLSLSPPPWVHKARRPPHGAQKFASGVQQFWGTPKRPATC